MNGELIDNTKSCISFLPVGVQIMTCINEVDEIEIHEIEENGSETDDISRILFVICKSV